MVRVILLVMDVLDRIDYLVPCLIRIEDVMIIVMIDGDEFGKCLSCDDRGDRYNVETDR